MTRTQAIQKYNENPKICLHCGSIIEVRENETPSDTRKKKFCNRSCAAQYNNTGSTRNAKNSINFCPNCGKRKRKTVTICKSCQNEVNMSRTMREVMNNNSTYSTSQFAMVRKYARKTLELSKREKVCQYCKNHEFDSIVEACHIKGIMEFDLNSSLSIVNSLDNLLWLCPNHHIMFDRGLIVL